jgi:hypothetical protein
MELLTQDGQPIDTEKVEQDFASMMAAPPKEQADKLNVPPKDKDEKPRASAPKTRARTTTKAASSPAAKASSAPADPAKVAQQRSDGIAGYVQIAAAGCLVTSQQLGSVPLAADAVTLANYAKPLGDAVAETAAANPAFAKVVDKITAAGPYAALAGVVIGMGMQLARNHGVKAAEMFGAVPPEKLLEAPDASSQ